MLPGAIFEDGPVSLFLGGLSAAESLVLAERIEHAFNFAAASVEEVQLLKAFLLKHSNTILLERPRRDPPLKLRIPLALGHAQRGVGAVHSIEIVRVVLERLAQWRGTVEARHAKSLEIQHLGSSCDTQEMEFHVLSADVVDGSERGQNLGGLERHHPTDGDIAVADLLKFAYRVGIGCRAPALGHADGLELVLLLLVESLEIRGQGDGQVLSF